VASTSNQLSSESSYVDTTSSFIYTSPAPNISIVADIISVATDIFQNLEFQNSSFSKTNTNSFRPCHNFALEVNIMESDCEDAASDKKMSPTMMDLTKLITSLSQQISQQSTFIQDQLLHQQSIIQDQKETSGLKIQHVLQDNKTFKRDIKIQLTNLRNLLAQQCNTATSTTNPIQHATSSVPSSYSPVVLNQSNTLVSPGVPQVSQVTSYGPSTASHANVGRILLEIVYGDGPRQEQ